MPAIATKLTWRHSLWNWGLLLCNLLLKIEMKSLVEVSGVNGLTKSVVEAVDWDLASL
jgi:hypothetical protein